MTPARRGDVEVVEVGGRQLALSNVDKVLWPRAGFRKGHMLDYYVRVAPALLPHLGQRPLTLHRFPDGVDGGHWFQKDCRGHPPWLPTKAVPSVLVAGKVLDYCLVNDLPALVWAANQGTVELHPLLARADDVDAPTVVAFDLDPGPPATVVDCCRVALAVRSLLDGLGLTAWPKTSGGKGLHLYVPLNTAATYPQTKRFARTVARFLAEEQPDRVVDRMARSLRPGKVLVDWSQNDPTKTTVAPYSLRATPRPTVSTPVTWDEVEAAAEAADPAALTFEAGAVIERVERLGDLFAPVLTVRQTMPA
ncbi:MAG: non-homologous end-joining DNA ligase [Actinomycetota bacterium]|nr:non-homologous end-joining DNA ligase [Actinomycetota bacterium]